jgi:hypothetical protein
MHGPYNIKFKTLISVGIEDSEPSIVCIFISPLKMDTAVLSAENKLQTVESEVCVHSKNL